MNKLFNLLKGSGGKSPFSPLMKLAEYSSSSDEDDERTR